MINLKQKLFLAVVALAGCIIALSGCEEVQNPRTHYKFTKGWKFALGDSAQCLQAGYDDASWRTLDLPHDWAIEGDFSESHPSGTGGGALPGGIAWYRKTFTMTPQDKGKNIYITFDGVYMNSTVYINGKEIGHRPYGYVSFRYDMTPYLKEGENIISVRVDNSKQPNSRWYSGCGIYRNVWITKTNNIAVDNWGTFVTTSLVSEAKADVQVKSRLLNLNNYPTEVTVVSTIVDAKGKKLHSVETDLQVQASDTFEVVQDIRLAQPTFWSLENPYRYTMLTEVYEDDKLVDVYNTSFGVRSFYFNAEEGFILNGKSVKINGVCQHHDLGCLGAAINRRALERQLEILKEMGCNGIRSSHNPPAPELLELCDSMGFIVMNETFDMWRKRKTTYDYSLYFNEWHERDLTDLILRDRNHPSVFMWSIGNEVLEQWTDANADTLDIAAANLLLNMKREASSLANDSTLSVNSLLTQKLCNMAHELDPTRPVTSGNNEPDPKNHLFRAGTLDIIGFNYHDDWFDGVPKNFPGKPFIVTESVSALMTRGYYKMPSDVEFLCPERWDKPYYDPSFSCSSYDNCHAPWGSRHEGTWGHVKYKKFICGQYIWAGFDYIGEPTPYGWPARSSFFGIIDLAGFPKDIYYMYQSEWTDKEVLHLFPHWNWKEGEEIDMWCYYNNADEVELFVNGESQGVQYKDSLVFHTSWRVKYQPGEVSVVSRKNGKQVGERTIVTAGRPAQIRMTADRSRIKADGEDLSFITVEVLDSEGNLCPRAENNIFFEIEGTGFIAGVDNGSPISLERFKDNHRKAFYGKCLVVVQSDGEAGNVRVKATSEGLQSGEVYINCLAKEQY